MREVRYTIELMVTTLHDISCHCSWICTYCRCVEVHTYIYIYTSLFAVRLDVPILQPSLTYKQTYEPTSINWSCPWKSRWCVHWEETWGNPGVSGWWLGFSKQSPACVTLRGQMTGRTPVSMEKYAITGPKTAGIFLFIVYRRIICILLLLTCIVLHIDIWVMYVSIIYIYAYVLVHISHTV